MSNIKIEIISMATRVPKKNTGLTDKWQTGQHRARLMEILRKLEVNQGFIISGAPDSVLYRFVRNTVSTLRDQHNETIGLNSDVVEPGMIRFWVVTKRNS